MSSSVDSISGKFATRTAFHRNSKRPTRLTAAILSAGPIAALAAAALWCKWRRQRQVKGQSEAQSSFPAAAQASLSIPAPTTAAGSETPMTNASTSGVGAVEGFVPVAGDLQRTDSTSAAAPAGMQKVARPAEELPVWCSEHNLPLPTPNGMPPLVVSRQLLKSLLRNRDMFVSMVVQVHRHLPARKLTTPSVLALHKAFIQVQLRGGYEAVCSKRQWMGVVRVLAPRAMDLPSNSPAAQIIRIMYERYLLAIEQYMASGQYESDVASGHFSYFSGSTAGQGPCALHMGQQPGKIEQQMRTGIQPWSRPPVTGQADAGAGKAHLPLQVRQQQQQASQHTGITHDIQGAVGKNNGSRATGNKKPQVPAGVAAKQQLWELAKSRKRLPQAEVAEKVRSVPAKAQARPAAPAAAAAQAAQACGQNIASLPAAQQEPLPPAQQQQAMLAVPPPPPAVQAAQQRQGQGQQAPQITGGSEGRMLSMETQAERPDVEADVTYDREVVPRNHQTADERDQVVEAAVRTIQRNLRGYFGRKRAAYLMARKVERDSFLREQSLKALHDAEEHRREEIQRRMHPRTTADFESLHQALESWRMQEIQKIKHAGLDNNKEQAMLAQLLQNEIHLLQHCMRGLGTNAKAQEHWEQQQALCT